MIYLKSFKLSPQTVKNPNAYPYNVFRKITGEVFVFHNITVLYGNNGSGKSTLLNLIAHKLNILELRILLIMVITHTRQII